MMFALGVKAGFTFSAGLFDYALNWSHATKPWLIIPIGLCFMSEGVRRISLATGKLTAASRRDHIVATTHSEGLLTVRRVARTRSG